MPSATSTDSLCSDVLSVDKRDLVPVTQLLSQKPVGATIGPGGPVDNQAVAQPGISLTCQAIENLLEGHHKGGRRSFLLPALAIAFRIPYGKAAVSHQIQNQAGRCEIALLEDPAIVVDRKGYLDAGTFLPPLNFRLEDGFLRRRGRTGNGAVGQLRVGFRRPLSGHGVPDEVQQKTLPEPIVPSDQIEARTEGEIELLQRADIGCVQVFLSSFFPTNRLCPATTKRDICSSKEDRFETTGCSQAVYETSLSTGCFLYPTRLEIFRCKRLKTESPHSLSDCEPLSNVWRCVELRR